VINTLGLADLSHHAYALVGGADVHLELLKMLAKGHSIKLAGNPDFMDRKYETFTIDDAREVKAVAETKPTVAGGKKIFVLTMSGITIEAQNALLKLLEEPPEYAHFFLILPSAHLLLPTVKSRIRLIGDVGKGSGKDASGSTELADAAKKFIAMPAKARLDFVKSFMEDISKEKKTKQDAVGFLNVLEEAVHTKGLVANKEGLEAIMLAGKYAADRAPSMKMLLEYVALVI